MRQPRRLVRIAAPVVAIAVAALPPRPAVTQGLLQSESAAAPADLQQSRYWLTFEREGRQLRLAGQVADELTRTVLTTYAAALFGGDRIDVALNGIENGEPVPPDWIPMAMAALDTLSEIDTGSAALTRGAIKVSGRVAEPEEAGALTRALREKLPPGIRVSTEFGIDAPDLVATVTFSPERCAYLMTRLAAESQILFDSGSAEIAEESKAGLTAIVDLFDRCPEAEIEVAGYTDSEGPEDVNLDLSQARAEAVMETLLARGIPLSRLRARGFGEADPVASNDTEAGRARNRRIEFKAVE